MNKERVKELIENAIYQLDPFTMDNSNYDDLCKNATKILEDALKELSKPDWVSVEERLPEYDKRVLVCNKRCPDYLAFTVRLHTGFYDNHEFIIENIKVTHWQYVEPIKE